MADSQPALQAGLQLHQSGRFSDAEKIYRQVLAEAPSRGDVWYLLGRVRHALGAPEEALEHYRKAVALMPSLAEAHNNLGICLKGQGNLVDAIAAYRTAIELRPAYVEAHNNLGNAYGRTGQLHEAVASFQRVLQLQPGFAEAHNNLGIVLKDLRQWEAAAASLCEAIRLRPNFAEAYANLGTVLSEQGRVDDARAAYQSALRFQPGFVEALCGLGYLEAKAGDLDGAEALFREAVRHHPGSAEAWGNLGYALAEQGRIAEGLDALRAALERAPESATNTSNYLYFLNYDPAVDTTALLEEHRRYAAIIQKAVGTTANHGLSRSQSGPLRVGYVSPDFRRHPVASFLEPILAHHDPRRVEIVCYSDVGTPDSTTDRFRNLAHTWRESRSLSDAALFDLIQQDRIDILVDLAGHTARNRLGIFARKPAPVQVTYLGYPGTTGLTTFDAMITDEIVDPSDAPESSTEPLYRLPGGFCCFAPPADAPGVAPSPASRNGYVTFGSLHKLPKLNERVLDLWSEVLLAIPSARLRLVRDRLRGRRRNEILACFDKHGVSSDRIEIHSTWRLEDHWTEYASIDVTLDVFPWCGHTTACESLWMGVPIITLATARRSARLSASVLKAVGLDDLIAETPAQYVETAARLAGSLEQLPAFRETIRGRMLTSALCDGPTFCRNLEDTYQAIDSASPARR